MAEAEIEYQLKRSNTLYVAYQIISSNNPN
jgi:hypothetical protein